MASTDNDRARPGNLGLALGAAAAVGVGAAAFLLRRGDDRGENERMPSDAPHWTLNDASQGERALVGNSVTIARPRQALFEIWRDFTRFPQFMDNVRSVEKLDVARSRWTIEAPAGRTVELVTRITEERPGERIYWQSEPESEIETSGMVSFVDAPSGRGTYVSLVLSYKPPGGALGKTVAKLFQREPGMQARRDLRRFKQLMETGEVTTNASPSGRASETPSQPHS